MSETGNFPELIRRVRAGDEAAAAELVKQFESTVRRVVRLRLDSRLKRVCDSMDICQAVLCSFFVRAASGQYELDTPEQLLKLLVTMARFKLSKAGRDQRAARRDDRRVEAGSVEDRDIRGNEASPSRQASARELLEEVHRRLSPEERKLVELRNQGLEWAAIATELGGNAEALRKKLTRALGRVSDELGLDEVADG